MKYFLSFQKSKKLHVVEDLDGPDNSLLVAQLNYELLKYGYMLAPNLIEALSTCSYNTLDTIFNDLVYNIKRVVPGGGYEIRHKNFPNITEDVDMDHTLKILDATIGFNTVNTPNNSIIGDEFAHIDDWTPIGTMTKGEFDDIFYNIVYSNNSISAFDKEVISWFTDNNYPVNLTHVKFAETRAFVGQKLLESTKTTILGTNNAMDVLRIWSIYSGGDEGLKEVTKFKQPKNFQKRILLATLEGCWDLEDVFKTKREQWLRMLYYLNPLSGSNKVKYPKLASYVYRLRNEPNTLQTFNSKVEKGISEKDSGVFDVLKRRMGVFSRRLDHLVRVFGEISIEKWIENKPNAKQLIDIYNHFTTRVAGGKRTAILAGQGSSQMVSYGELEPLSEQLVADIHLLSKDALKELLGGKLGKVFIDDRLYFRPIASNNRAASLTLTSTAIGTTEPVDLTKVIRAYVAWEGSSDIDMSAFIINKDNSVNKIGWDAANSKAGITYSGDNTGNYAKNAEYLQIASTPAELSNMEYIVVTAVIYSGPTTYAAYKKPVYIGQQVFPKASPVDRKWYPANVTKAVALACKANSAYLFAIHVPSSTMIHLDMSMDRSNVTNKEDALSMRVFLNKFVTATVGTGVDWSSINQGHVLNLCATEIVTDPKDADIVFDDNTTSEEVTKYIG